MKRISLLAIVASLVFTNASYAWWYSYSYTPLRYRIRYSPHAYGHDHSGLISGCTRYSMHAVGHKNTGLVSAWTRYTPYAFGTKHNGLVHDPATCWSACAGGQDVLAPPRVHAAVESSPCCKGVPKTGQMQSRRHMYRSGRSRRVTQAVGWDRPSRINQRKIIQGYLEERFPDRVTFTRSYKIGDEYASFDAVIDNGRMIVKYWNPGKLAELKASNYGLGKRYERYIQTCAQAYLEAEERGGTVVHVASNDTDQVMQTLCKAVDQLESRNRMVCQDLPLARQ